MVLHLDPAIVADEVVLGMTQETVPPPVAGGTSDDIRVAFGG